MAQQRDIRENRKSKRRSCSSGRKQETPLCDFAANSNPNHLYILYPVSPPVMGLLEALYSGHCMARILRIPPWEILRLCKRGGFFSTGGSDFLIRPDNPQIQRKSRETYVPRLFLTLKLTAPVWSEWRESNSRPLEPHSSALPNCATPGHWGRQSA